MTVDAAELTPVEPAITDGHAFSICPHDLRFLQISETAVEQWRERVAPLGLAGSYLSLLNGIHRALAADGYSQFELAVRGSSIAFFGNWRKQVPSTREAWRDIFEQEWLGPPDEAELDEIAVRWVKWLQGREAPERRPFDSLYRLGIGRDPSDIDLQLSCSDATVRAHDAWHDARARGNESFLHPLYGFVVERFASLALPNTYQFLFDHSDNIGRPVTLKLFGAAGPPEAIDLDHPEDEIWAVPRAGRG